MENQVIVLEREFNIPISKIWKAITDKDEMKVWYFDLAEFKAKPGFKFEFVGGPPENEYVHECEITEAIPDRKLTYSWKYKGFPGCSYVTFDLSGQQDKTLLKLTHSGINTFPKDNPDFAIHNFEGGWNYIIHTSLKNYLNEFKQ